MPDNIPPPHTAQANGVHPGAEVRADCPGFTAVKPGGPLDPGDDPIDSKTPHAARVYNYWLGGKDNYAADRMVAEQITDAYPYVRASAQANRAFHRRSAAWMARAGIRQFLDVGCGLPTADNTHDIVQHQDPAARVVYADHDPMVAVHARALLAGSPGVVAVRGDVRQPEAILNSREARSMLRPGEPTGLLLTAILHFVEDKDDPVGLVARLMAGLAAGSCVAISHGSTDKLPQRAADAGLQAYERVLEPAVMRTWHQVRDLFTGLELLPPWKGAVPAVVTVDGWLSPDVPLADAVPLQRPGGEALWCGIGRKP